MFKGTQTLETCENGLVFDGHGSVYNYCNYNWAVDCGKAGLMKLEHFKNPETNFPEINDDIQNVFATLSPFMFISWVCRVQRVYDDTPISSPGCLYQYGIYPVGEGCQTTFFKVI